MTRLDAHLAAALTAGAVALIATACGGAAVTSSPGGANSSPHPTSATPTSPGAADTNPAGDIPDTQQYVSFTPPRGSVTLAVPEGWAQSSSATATIFASHFNSVAVEIRSAAVAPSADAARQNDVPALRSSVANFALGRIETVQRRAGSAVLITYEADSAADPVTGKVQRLAVERYEFWHNGTELLVTLSGLVGADNVDPWRRVTDSVSWR